MYEKLKRFLKRKDEYIATDPRNITGEDYHFWATYNKDDFLKLRDLLECLVLDARVNKGADKEEEEVMRRLANSVVNTIIWCNRDYKDELLRNKEEAEEKEHQESLESRTDGMY